MVVANARDLVENVEGAVEDSPKPIRAELPSLVFHDSDNMAVSRLPLANNGQDVLDFQRHIDQMPDCAAVQFLQSLAEGEFYVVSAAIAPRVGAVECSGLYGHLKIVSMTTEVQETLRGYF